MPQPYPTTALKFTDTTLVSHGSPGHVNVPSIAAVVATQNWPDIFHYQRKFRLPLPTINTRSQQPTPGSIKNSRIPHPTCHTNAAKEETRTNGVGEATDAGKMMVDTQAYKVDLNKPRVLEAEQIAEPGRRTTLLVREEVIDGAAKDIAGEAGNSVSAAENTAGAAKIIAGAKVPEDGVAVTKGELAAEEGELATVKEELAAPKGKLADLKGVFVAAKAEPADPKGMLAAAKGKLAATKGKLVVVKGEITVVAEKSTVVGTEAADANEESTADAIEKVVAAIEKVVAAIEKVVAAIEKFTAAKVLVATKEEKVCTAKDVITRVVYKKEENKESGARRLEERSLLREPTKRQKDHEEDREDQAERRNR